MKTYMVDLNGVPKLAFRAKDDAAAANWPKRGIGKWCVQEYAAGDVTVRPATIPEQAAWRAQSVSMDELNDEYGVELKPGSYGSGPDYWVLLLDPDDCALADKANISRRLRRAH